MAPPLDHNVKKTVSTAPPAGRMTGHLPRLSVTIWIIVTTPIVSLLTIEQFMWKLVCVLLNVSFYLFLLSFRTVIVQSLSFKLGEFPYGLTG